MKVDKELKQLLLAIEKEVSRWPKWKRSLDPIGKRPR